MMRLFNFNLSLSFKFYWTLVLAGNISSAGAQIKNCQYKGTINGAASTLIIATNADTAVLENNTEISE